MSTPHNEANLGNIAKTVVMPGDPLRAKYIAENFLEDAVLVNNVRGINGYTGYYKGKKVKIYEAYPGEETDDKDFGKVWGYFEDKGLGIVAGGNIVYIREFHVENSKRMAVSEYMKGHSLEPGDFFTGKEE